MYLVSLLNPCRSQFYCKPVPCGLRIEASSFLQHREVPCLISAQSRSRQQLVNLYIENWSNLVADDLDDLPSHFLDRVKHIVEIEGNKAIQ